MGNSTRLTTWAKPIERRESPLANMSKEQLILKAESLNIEVARSWSKRQILEAISAEHSTTTSERAEDVEAGDEAAEQA